MDIVDKAVAYSLAAQRRARETRRPVPMETKRLALMLSVPLTEPTPTLKSSNNAPLRAIGE
jgi:hypothetical protein